MRASSDGSKRTPLFPLLRFPLCSGAFVRRMLGDFVFILAWWSPLNSHPNFLPQDIRHRVEFQLRFASNMICFWVKLVSARYRINYFDTVLVWPRRERGHLKALGLFYRIKQCTTHLYRTRRDTRDKSFTIEAPKFGRIHNHMCQSDMLLLVSTEVISFCRDKYPACSFYNSAMNTNSKFPKP